MKNLKRISFTSLFSLLLFLTCQPLLAQAVEAPWRLKTQQDNITVYTRSSDRSDVKEVRITAKFHIDIEVFMATLNDVNQYDKWVYKGMHPEVIETISKGEYYYYIQSDLPFPLSDRDLVVHSRQWKDPHTNTYHTHSVAAPKKRTDEKGMVRITFYESFWKIHQNDDGTLDIDYKVIVDPAGSLPAWVINMAVTQGPLKSMKKLEAFALENMRLVD